MGKFISVLVIVVLIGGGGWWYLKNGKDGGNQVVDQLFASVKEGPLVINMTESGSIRPAEQISIKSPALYTEENPAVSYLVGELEHPFLDPCISIFKAEIQDLSLINVMIKEVLTCSDTYRQLEHHPALAGFLIPGEYADAAREDILYKERCLIKRWSVSNNV